MKLAWFRPTRPDDASVLDDTAALIAELRCTHDITVFTEDNAHDFVWMHFRAPFELCVHELDDTPSHQFIWPYLLHYGGVLSLRALSLNESRADGLARQGRSDDYHAEFAFGRGWSMLRAPLLAVRLAVVPHATAAAALQEQYPEARIRCVPTGVNAYEPRRHGDTEIDLAVLRASVPPSPAIRFGMLEDGRLDVLTRAMERARDAGARAELLIQRSPGEVVRDADVILALGWPPAGEPQTAALVGMAAGRPVVVLETEVTADWPSIDPQTWQPRGLPISKPVVVSIDPRDEEHSLVLAIRRLAEDEPLRAQLGASAREWWGRHATARHAAARWLAVLDEAASLAPPARPSDWPPHLTADGTELAREILRDIGTSVDLF
jgi:hypothetical protein